MYHKKQTKISTQQETVNLPFHCKEVGTINKDAIMELAADPKVPRNTAARLKELWKYVDDESMYKAMGEAEIDNSGPSRLTKADLKAKREVGQLVQIDRKDVRYVTKRH
eukprot:PhF_6_TR6244/c3_g4_i6/m.9439